MPVISRSRVCHKCNLVPGHYPYSTTVLIQRGIARGIPTRYLAEEVGINYSYLLERRHYSQGAPADGSIP